MNREKYSIYSKGKIGSLVLKNRLVRSATCDYQATEDGRITPQILELYKNLSAGGVGMIITGLLGVSSKGIGTKGQLCLYNDTYIEELTKLTKIVHETNHDTPIIAQLCHPGRQITQEHNSADCIAPSAVDSPILIKKAKEMSTLDIHSVISDFVNAIVRAKDANFDGVELHAAHGYLLSSFLSPYTNKRKDEYGGNVIRRTKIIREIINQAREKVGKFPILIKMNCDDHVPGGISKDNFKELATEITSTGVDAIELSGAMWDSLAFTEDFLGFLPVPIPESRTHIDSVEKQSYYYNYTKDLNLSIPIILVGGHRDIEHMEVIVKSGQVDFLSLSRPLICEPELPNRWLQGIGSKKSGCLSCNACMLFKDSFSCAFRRLHLNRREFETNLEQGWRAVFK